MELRHLKYFLMVSKMKNYTHAAQNLHISQPAVTNAIKHLESEVGVKLLNRNTKRVTLTAQGEVFAERVENIMSQLYESVVEIKEMTNQIKLGLPPIIGAYLFPDIFTESKKVFNDFELTITEKGSLATLKMIEQGELDIGIIILPKNTASIDCIPLIRDEIKVCLSESHSLSHEAKIDFSMLKKEQIIIMTNEFVHNKIFYELCSSYNFMPNIILTTNKLNTVKSLIEKGVGLSLLMNLFVSDNPLIVKKPLTKSIEVTIGIVWKKNRYLSNGSTQFIDFIYSYFLAKSELPQK